MSIGASDPAPAEVAARLRGVVVVRGRHRALTDGDVAIPSGAVTALIGPNGSGKSTVLRLLGGLLAPTEGEVVVLGGRPRDVRRRVAHVLQSPTVGDELPLTVADAVRMGRYARRGALHRLRDEDHRAVDEAMDRLQVADLADRQVTELSGGQRQRVLVAQGLAQGADLLLLDEPVTALDVVSRQRILEVIDEERAAGRTVVLTTHDLDEAASADQVVLLAGRVVACGTPDEVLVPDRLRAAYGGKVLVVGSSTVLVDDPHHHAEGHDHTVCDEDDEPI